MRTLKINMNLDQYEALTDLICFAYDNGYYHNKYNTTHNVFDDMADSVIGAKRLWITTPVSYTHLTLPTKA